MESQKLKMTLFQRCMTVVMTCHWFPLWLTYAKKQLFLEPKRVQQLVTQEGDRQELYKQLLLGSQQFEGVGFGGFARDMYLGVAPHDLDIQFPEEINFLRFEEWLNTQNTFMDFDISHKVSNLTYIGKVCSTITLKNNVGVSLSLDCVFPNPSLHHCGCDETANICIDFDVNALIVTATKTQKGIDLSYKLNDEIVSLFSDCEYNFTRIVWEHVTTGHFSYIGATLGTPKKHPCFESENKHGCMHRKSSSGKRMMRRAAKLISRGWKLDTTCENSECWCAPKEQYDAYIQHLKEERARILAEKKAAREKFLADRQAEKELRMIKAREEKRKRDLYKANCFCINPWIPYAKVQAQKNWKKKNPSPKERQWKRQSWKH